MKHNHQINLKLAKLLSAKEKLGQNYEYEAIFRMQYLTTIRIFAGFIIFWFGEIFPGIDVSLHLTFIKKRNV